MPPGCEPGADGEQRRHPPRPTTGSDGYVERSEHEWQRLHPLTPVVRAGRVSWALLIVALTDLSARGRSNPEGLLIDLGLMVVVVSTSVVSWLVTRWRIENGVLLIEGGLIRKTSRRFPPEQIQAVDTVNPLIARVFGLSEIRIRMAASTGSSARLAYLEEADAVALRARLLALAHGVAEHTQAPPEQLLFSVPTGRLIASVLLSGPGVLAEVAVVAILAVALLAPTALPEILGSGATYLLVVVTAVWRRLNNEYGLTLAEAPDGLRVRAGLLQTAAETIPRGRIQAVRMVEPLLWRPFGWCRIVVDVAGKQRSNREGRNLSGSLRAVLPVGGRDQAVWLIARLVPDFTSAAAPSSPPPRRVRVKSPLRYHYLSWGASGSYAVTTSGRLRRITDWVPLAKVQSVRQVQGPLQRFLKVSSVHLDTAGRNVHAVARDRDLSESHQLVSELPLACRLARASS